MCQDAGFFTSVMWCHQPTPWHCNQQLIWITTSSNIPCSMFFICDGPFASENFWMLPFPEMRCHHPQYCARRCKKDLTFDGCLVSKVQSPKLGAKESVFFGINERLKKAGGHVYTQERQAARRRRRRNRNRRNRTLLFLWNFFCDFQTRTSDLFWRPKVLQASQGSAPVSGLQCGVFFNGTFLTKGDTHGVTHFFPGWNWIYSWDIPSWSFLFFVCAFCLLATLRTQLGMLGWCKKCWSSWKCLSLLGSNTSNDFESLLWHFPTNYQFLVFIYAADQYFFSTRPGSLMRRVSWFAKGELIQSLLRQRKQFSRSCH